jgi:hypothetical protein
MAAGDLNMKSRILGALAPALAFALFSLPAHADDAASQFSDALSSGCHAWLGGKSRSDLDQLMTAAGWKSEIEGMMFTRSGGWGSLMAQMTGDETPESNPMKDYLAKMYEKPPPPPLKRRCQLSITTNAVPWTTAPIVDVITQWVGGTYPGASVARKSGIMIDNHPVDATFWTAGNVTTMMAVEQAKNPSMDVLVRIDSN